MTNMYWLAHVLTTHFSSLGLSHIKAYKAPLQPQSGTQQLHSLQWKPVNFESQLWSVGLSVLQGEIDGKALVDIWQLDRKITYPVFHNVLLTSSVVIYRDGKTLT